MSIQPAGVPSASRMGLRTSRWSSVSAIAALDPKGNAGGVRAAVFGQRCAVLLLGAGRPRWWVDGQRSEQALGFPGVAEGQCGLRVVGQQARLGGHGLDHWVLQMPLLGIDQPEKRGRRR